MELKETRLKGLYVVDIKRLEDERGFFARTFCEEAFAKAGISNSHFKQFNISFNKEAGTLRGMHYQDMPKPEVKLLRCTKGAIHDVIVDLRKGSDTYCQWMSFELTEENRTALYVPAGFAHGFQTLTADTEVSYAMGELYYPELARGVRWDDPAFAIKWPIKNPILSPKDKNYPDFSP